MHICGTSQKHTHNMNKILLAIAAVLITLTASAQQQSTGGIQQVKCTLADVVGVGLGGGSNGGSGGGSSVVDIPMSGTGAMASGIESPEFTINLFANAMFDVSVQASATAFTYAGTATSGTNMLVKDVLSVIISANNTGGNVANGFSAYQTVDGTNGKRVIGDGQVGVRSFGFKYKATPGFNYPAGTYTTDIVYTITKH